MRHFNSSRPEPQEAICAEHETSFGRIIAREEPHLRRYALSLARDADDAEDLTQECLLRALRSQHQYTRGSHVRRWLFTILRNLHVDQRRRVGRRGHDLPIEDVYPTPSQPPAQEARLALNSVAERIGTLRAHDRRVLEMSVFEGLSQEEIASRMGTAVGTVKSRLSRTRRTLAEAT